MLPEIGSSYRFRKTFSESDIYLYGGIICDSSPWHIDEVYARNSIFKKRLVYGMLTGSLFSTIIGRYFPGYIYLSQKVIFTQRLTPSLLSHLPFWVVFFYPYVELIIFYTLFIKYKTITVG